MSAIIQTKDLRFSYPAAEGVTPVVLDGVSLDIEEEIGRASCRERV